MAVCLLGHWRLKTLGRFSAARLQRYKAVQSRTVLYQCSVLVYNCTAVYCIIALQSNTALQLYTALK